MADRFAVRWSATAEADLTAILEYVARQDGSDRAVSLYENLHTRVSTLAFFPGRGRVVPELQAIGLRDVRELLVGPYRVFFRIDDRFVVILGVVDGRRDLAELLIERTLRGAGHDRDAPVESDVQAHGPSSASRVSSTPARHTSNIRSSGF